MKNKFRFLLSFLFLCVMLLMPACAKEGARDGLCLWYQSLLPSLFPYTILSLYMLKLTNGKSHKAHPHIRHILDAIGISADGLFACFTGFLCGYPLGAKMIGETTASGRISRTQGQYLLSFANNASPAFLVQYLSLSLLNCTACAPILAGSVYGASAFTALLFWPIYRRQTAKQKRQHTRHDSAVCTGETESAKENGAQAASVGDCIGDACAAMLRLCGYLVLFSIITKMVTAHVAAVTIRKAFLIGVIEITNGAAMLAGLSIPLAQKLMLLSFCTAFGGVCCLAQSAGMCQNSGLSMPLYLLAKLLNGLLAVLLTLFFLFLKTI